jgi:hypothetical protein
LELDDRSLAIPRSPENRVIACCREFATLFCAILRSKGIPSRSRCGFATYFNPEYYEDHWICEYWGGTHWIRVDPQIDPIQQSILQDFFIKSANDDTKERIILFNPLQLTERDFLVAGEAWLECRKNGNNPEKFGIGCDPKKFGLETLHGLWFIRGNLLRDFAALNKIETVPYLIRIGSGLSWEPWRLISAKDEDLSENDWTLLDKIAELSLNVDKSFDDILRMYNENKDLQVPEEIIKSDRSIK